MTSRPMNDTASCTTRRNTAGRALVGGLLWAITPWLPGAPPAFGSLHHVFLFFPLVVMPLVLALAMILLQPRSSARAIYRFAQRVQPIASVLVLASFSIEHGALAGVLVVPWLALAVLLAIAGARAASIGTRPHLSRANLTAAHVFLLAAAVWLLLSRVGTGPSHLTPVEVFMAVVHFHFSGVALQILIAAIAARLPAAAPRLGKVHRVIAIAAIVAIPLIASGKLLDIDALKLVGVTTMIAAALTVAVLGFTVARTMESVTPRRLLLVSAGSVAVGMVLASVYGIGQISGRALLGIDGMVTSHGLIHAIGFVMCGLLGFVSAGPDRRA